MVARSATGQTVVYPVTEMVFDPVLHLCNSVVAPANLNADTERRARDLAVAVVQALEGVGVFGVELFLLADGSLLVNETAPRPHNSGHYTIDACITSQFEQQVRALVGLPLGDPRMHSYAAMVNILGDVWKDQEPAWDKVLEHTQLKLHLYGKHEPRPGRKMGHFTLLGRDVETVAAQALLARSELGIG